MPGAGMIEFLVDHGHDVYLLDWGEIAEEHKELGFEEAVLKILPRAIARAMETSGSDDITLNGLCLGRTISSCYLALNSDAPVQNFVAVVAPSTLRREACSVLGSTTRISRPNSSCNATADSPPA